jgi:hypothetical protein
VTSPGGCQNLLLYYFDQFGQKLAFLHFRKISENLKNQEKIKSGIKKIGVTRDGRIDRNSTVSPAFQGGDINTHANALWIPMTRRMIPATISPRTIVLLGVSTPINQVPSILLTLLLTSASNMKFRMMMMIAKKSRRCSPYSNSNIRSSVCSH